MMSLLQPKPNNLLVPMPKLNMPSCTGEKAPDAGAAEEDGGPSVGAAEVVGLSFVSTVGRGGCKAAATAAEAGVGVSRVSRNWSSMGSCRKCMIHCTCRARHTASGGLLHRLAGSTPRLSNAQTRQTYPCDQACWSAGTINASMGAACAVLGVWCEFLRARVRRRPF